MENSIVARHLINLYKKWEHKISYYLKTSRTVGLIKELKEDFYLLPIKTTSIVISAAIITNIFLCAMFKKEMDLWGWIVRGWFLLAGIFGLFSNTSWQDIKKGE